MRNPNNLRMVTYPNGVVRYRNCQTTVEPTDRRPLPKGWSATADLYSRVNYAKLSLNTLNRKVDHNIMSLNQYYRRELYRTVLITGAILLTVAIAITEAI